jgi:hypothetical protein
MAKQSSALSSSLSEATTFGSFSLGMIFTFGALGHLALLLINILRESV